MDAFLEEERFVDFGTDPLFPYPAQNLGGVAEDRLDALRTAVRNASPKAPGVYGMIDRRQRLIYVGKSKSLRSRLLSYFLPINAEDKQGRIVESASQIVWETQPSEFAALLREQQLIRRWTPRWNVQGIPKRQRPVFLCLGRSPAATFYLSNLPVTDAVACEGPFHGAGRMARVVEILNKFFQLRDCGNGQPMRYADQLALFDIEERAGCLRFEIGTCLGPCIGACTRTAYTKQVQAAQRFLEGLDDGPLCALRNTMAIAAAKQQFELATRLREDLAAIQYLHRKLTLLAGARRNYSFIYAAPAAERSVWYLIAHGQVRDAVAAPHNGQTLKAIRPQLRRWQQTLDAAGRPTENTFLHTLPLVAAWFRKNPAELSRTFQPREVNTSRFLVGAPR